MTTTDKLNSKIRLSHEIKAEMGLLIESVHVSLNKEEFSTLAIYSARLAKMQEELYMLTYEIKSLREAVEDESREVIL